MRALLLASTLVALIPLAVADDLLASGHIAVGDAGNMAFLLGEPTGLTGFGFVIPDGVATLRTQTASASALPHQLRLDLYLGPNETDYLGTCAGALSGEVACIVPPEANYAFVGAYVGVDLTVDVRG